MKIENIIENLLNNSITKEEAISQVKGYLKINKLPKDLFFCKQFIL